MAAKVRGSQVWVAVNLDDAIKQQIQAGVSMPKPGVPMMAPV